MFEKKIVFEQLYDYLITNGLLFESQYGFRKQHSAELAALELTDRIRREMDRDDIPFSVLLDLSKAFETLNHHILLSKLAYYRIKSIALQWFQSYLTQRQQFVEYEEVCLSTRELKTSVSLPQGSILGPLLFLIYMNDKHTVSDKLNFILYAEVHCLLMLNRLNSCFFTMIKEWQQLNISLIWWLMIIRLNGSDVLIFLALR